MCVCVCHVPIWELNGFRDLAGDPPPLERRYEQVRRRELSPEIRTGDPTTNYKTHAVLDTQDIPSPEFEAQVLFV